VNNVANRAIVYLVGAGPGDPKLITIKGLECIKRSDVIVYDRLVSPKLLNFARLDAEIIYAGKTPDHHTLIQTEINNLLVSKAKENKVVTRLKGGDPYVFGRGGEEAEALKEHGIPFEIVPGITSAIAVPAYAGIPVTHRNINSSFAVVTGNEVPDRDGSRIAWDKLATATETIIFLMGMSNLRHITSQLIKHGRDPNTPVALIRWGTRPEQETLTGVLDNIANLAESVGFKHPVTIIVGEVVKMRDKLKWFENKPLFGKRVLVTRSRSQASILSSALEELGAEAYEFPVIEFAPPLDYTPFDEAIQELRRYNWIVFTSANGVIAFFSRLRELDKDIRDLTGVKICAIGPATMEAIKNHSLKVDFYPEEYIAESLIKHFRQEDLCCKRFLLPRADIARQFLVDELRNMGAIVDEVVAYRTIKTQGNVELLQKLLNRGAIHAITFTSSSTVINFLKSLEEIDIPKALQGVIIACIGPITALTAKEKGLPVHLIAKEYTIEGLVKVLSDHFTKTSK
jgi:uroporphyrinogen III methyltransferase/synthase